MRLLSIVAFAAAVLLAACSEVPQGDAMRGATLHEGCLDCHGTGPYTNPQRKIKSAEALRKEVQRWGDYYNPALSTQDVDDLTAYLNQNFYKF